MIDHFFPQTPIPDLYAGHALVKDLVPEGFALWSRQSNGFVVRTGATLNAKGATHTIRQLPEIANGKAFDFEIYCNASIQKKNKLNKKWVYHIRAHEEDMLKVWFLNRTFANGFAITGLDINARIEMINRGPTPHEINHTKFSGSLIVSDEEKFKQAMCSGIGRAKAFGCGLLSLS